MNTRKRYALVQLVIIAMCTASTIGMASDNTKTESLCAKLCREKSIGCLAYIAACCALVKNCSASCRNKMANCCESVVTYILNDEVQHYQRSPSSQGDEAKKVSQESLGGGSNRERSQAVYAIYDNNDGDGIVGIHKHDQRKTDFSDSENDEIEVDDELVTKQLQLSDTLDFSSYDKHGNYGAKLQNIKALTGTIEDSKVIASSQ